MASDKPFRIEISDASGQRIMARCTYIETSRAAFNWSFGSVASAWSQTAIDFRNEPWPSFVRGGGQGSNTEWRFWEKPRCNGTIIAKPNVNIVAALLVSAGSALD